MDAEDSNYVEYSSQAQQVSSGTSHQQEDFKDDFVDRARGCILGAFVGDAAGAVLEFFPRKIQEKDVEKALQFQGGGQLNVNPGQITDDSEMAMSLMHGIINSEEGADQATIAEWYIKWLNSKPYDIGFATITAISLLEQGLNGSTYNSLNEAINEVANENKNSKSNGCLMRATPMSVYASKSDLKRIKELTELDVRLTHSNPTCIHTVTAYNIAIVHLLNNGDTEGAIKEVDSYISEATECDDLIDSWNKIKNDETEDNLRPAHESVGYLLIAFEYAFFYLKHGFTYEKAIASMLLHGGDTDTNAAIVGGLLGAKHGASNIPDEWKEAVLNSTFTKVPSKTRPEWLWPQNKENFYELIDKLIAKIPE